MRSDGRRDVPASDPVLPSLELPSRKTGGKSVGLGPIQMDDPLQDAQTLVSTPSPVPQADEPISGGTQVVAMPGGTQVAAVPIPKAAPTPASIIPGGRGASRSAVPFLVAGVAAALTWGIAGAAGFLHEPDALPDLATGKPPAASAPKPSASAPSPSTPAAAAGAAAPAGAAPDTPVADAAPPPPASWNVAAEGVPRNLRLVGGVAVASFGDKVVGYSSGAAAWTFEGEHSAVFGMDDGSVAIVQADAVVGVSATDGTERFKAALLDPAKAGKKNAPTVVAADADATRVLVALSDARFMLIAPSSCAEPQGECTATVGRLSGEFLEDSSKVALGEDGALFLAEEDSIRAFDGELHTVFEASTPSNVRSMIRVPGGRLGLQFAQEAALLAPESCRGRSEVRLRTGDTQAPSGCVLWRYGRAIDPVPPAAVDTSSLALNERGKLQVVAEGDDAWKIPLGAFGPVVHGDGVLYTLAADGDALSLAIVDATNGSLVAKHTVQLAANEEDRADAKLTWNAGSIALSVGSNIAVLSLSGTG